MPVQWFPRHAEVPLERVLVHRLSVAVQDHGNSIFLLSECRNCLPPPPSSFFFFLAFFFCKTEYSIASPCFKHSLRWRGRLLEGGECCFPSQAPMGGSPRGVNELITFWPTLGGGTSREHSSVAHVLTTTVLHFHRVNFLLLLLYPRQSWLSSNGDIIPPPRVDLVGEKCAEDSIVVLPPTLMAPFHPCRRFRLLPTDLALSLWQISRGGTSKVRLNDSSGHQSHCHGR